MEHGQAFHTRGIRQSAIVGDERIGLVADGQRSCKMKGIEAAHMGLPESGSPVQNRVVKPNQYQRIQHSVCPRMRGLWLAGASECPVHFDA